MNEVIIKRLEDIKDYKNNILQLRHRLLKCKDDERNKEIIYSQIKHLEHLIELCLVEIKKEV